MILRRYSAPLCLPRVACSLRCAFACGLSLLFTLFSALSLAEDAKAFGSAPRNALYIYTLTGQGTPESYDEAMAVACLQGIINRDGPRLYVLSANNKRPQYWIDLLSHERKDLGSRPVVPVQSIDDLRALAADHVKGAIIWDHQVPATVNVATTIAGIKNGVVLSPEFADRYLAKWNLSVIEDLRGHFDGHVTGSAKNDAYRWAIQEFLAKGLCSSHLICLYEDANSTRAHGDIGYVDTRDWAVINRAFVSDLSPWGDEAPKDDPKQALGTDLATYRMILSEVMKHAEGKRMTEMTGFFAFWKYSNVAGFASTHEPVPTEWESVYVISPFNCYQNTISSDCFNESFHSQMPFQKLKQSRPKPIGGVEKKAYVCILMADYDSATPLYDFMPKQWDDPNRGKLPLAWGINPNLIETYPDIVTHLYATATPNDHFTSDASAAGYMNPNRVKPECLPLFIEHNKHFFRATDMTMAPMVLDWDEPSPAVKNAFTQFARDGYATIVMDMHNKGGKTPQPQVWDGMPVTELINNTCNFANPKQTSDAMFGAIKERGNALPGFYFFRIVWTPPSAIIDSLDVFRHEHPDVPLEVVDPYNFFSLFRKQCSRILP